VCGGQFSHPHLCRCVRDPHPDTAPKRRHPQRPFTAALVWHTLNSKSSSIQAVYAAESTAANVGSGAASPGFSPVLAAAATPGQHSFLPAPSLAAAVGVATPDAGRSALESSKRAPADSGTVPLALPSGLTAAQSSVIAAGSHGLDAESSASEGQRRLVDVTAADPLPAGFSPVQAAALTPQPHFVPAASLADTVTGSAGQDIAQPATDGRRALFPPVDAAAASPAQRFIPAPSLAAMAGLSTPDPWRGGQAGGADDRGAAVTSPARSALAETERAVRARVQACAAFALSAAGKQ